MGFCCLVFTGPDGATCYWRSHRTSNAADCSNRQVSPEIQRIGAPSSTEGSASSSASGLYFADLCEQDSHY